MKDVLGEQDSRETREQSINFEMPRALKLKGNSRTRANRRKRKAREKTQVASEHLDEACQEISVPAIPQGRARGAKRQQRKEVTARNGTALAQIDPRSIIRCQFCPWKGNILDYGAHAEEARHPRARKGSARQSARTEGGATRPDPLIISCRFCNEWSGDSADYRAHRKQAGHPEPGTKEWRERNLKAAPVFAGDTSSLQVSCGFCAEWKGYVGDYSLHCKEARHPRPGTKAWKAWRILGAAVDTAAK